MAEQTVTEKTANHTPGPWRALEHNSGASIVSAGPFEILLTNRIGAKADVWTKGFSKAPIPFNPNLHAHRAATARPMEPAVQELPPVPTSFTSKGF